MTTSEQKAKTIAVLGGTGAEGRGIALRMAVAGYRVIIGSRDAARAAAAAQELVAQASAAQRSATVLGMANLEAASEADLVVLAVPFSAQVPTALEIAQALTGKILIDVTVPLVPPKVARVQLPSGGSAVELLQQQLGAGVRVVSAFQNVSAHQLSHIGGPVECDVLVCGDAEDAREAVVCLANDMGLRAYHAGTLANSAAAEALTSVLIFMNRRYKIEQGAGIRITGVNLD